jgi:predicted RNase H-like nuclease (RuvC/YqgF family)
MYDEAGAAIQEQVSTQEVFANNTGQARPESAWGRIKQLRSSREAAKAVQAKHGKATEKTKSTQKIKEEIGSIPDKIQNAQNELGKTETEIQTLETKGDLNAAETAKLTHLLTKKDRLSEKVEALEIRASDLQRQIDNANQMDSLNTAMAKQADKDK